MIKEKFERFRSLISAEPYNTDLDLFNKTKWFDEAWGTFQRTLFYMDPPFIDNWLLPFNGYKIF